MINQSDWKWFGSAGHLCVSNYCRFHMRTEVGDVVISTIGEYVFNCEFKAIDGFGHKYESMIFTLKNTTCDCGCGMREVLDYSELDHAGYDTAKEANEGHLAMCLKYANAEGPRFHEVPAHE